MIHDNAPFLYLTVPEEDLIQVQTRVSFQGIHQYDQAGLMVRRGPGSWIKTSVEFEDEHSPARLGSVVTNSGWSDWATQDVTDVKELSFRITKYNRDDVCVQYNASPDEREDAWSQIRIARLLPVESVGDATYGKEEERTLLRVGLYCCCPVESGYRPLFHYLDVRKLSKQDCPIACVDAF
jgi:regulation of enolase protein 1 (concanavalin A-like superfamily)